MPLIDEKYFKSAKVLAGADDEVLQAAGIMALMRLETLEKRMKGDSSGIKALTPLPSEQAVRDTEKTKNTGETFEFTSPFNKDKSGQKNDKLFNFIPFGTPAVTPSTPTTKEEAIFDKNKKPVTKSTSFSNSFSINNFSGFTWKTTTSEKKEATIVNEENKITAQATVETQNTISNDNVSNLIDHLQTTTALFPSRRPQIGSNEKVDSLNISKKLENISLYEHMKKPSTKTDSINVLVPLETSKKTTETQTDVNKSKEVVLKTNERDLLSLRSSTPSSVSSRGNSGFLERRDNPTANINEYISINNRFLNQTFNSGNNSFSSFDSNPRQHERPFTLNNYILNVQQPERRLLPALRRSSGFGGGGGCRCRQTQCADRRCGCNKSGSSCGSSCLCSSRGGWCLNR